MNHEYSKVMRTARGKFLALLGLIALLAVGFFGYRYYRTGKLGISADVPSTSSQIIDLSSQSALLGTKDNPAVTDNVAIDANGTIHLGALTPSAAPTGANQIALTTDKTIYKPGDTVRFTVTNIGKTAVDLGIRCGIRNPTQITLNDVVVYRGPMPECAYMLHYPHVYLQPGQSNGYAWTTTKTTKAGTYQAHFAIGSIAKTISFPIAAS